MEFTSVRLVLAISTAWATVFLGALPASALRLHSPAVLKACGAWALVGLTSPGPVRHWYFIFAIICMVSWLRLIRDRALDGKIWLSIAAGLGISIGIVFFIQAAPALCQGTLPMQEYLLLLASIYLGGATSGLAYAGWVSTPVSTSRTHARDSARLLAVLAALWCTVVASELRLRPHFGAHALPARTWAFLMSLALATVLSWLAFHAVRAGAPMRAKRLFAAVAVFAFAVQLFARWLRL
jgi:hypothetical protein